jgi:excisionase family DNA binding protein
MADEMYTTRQAAIYLGVAEADIRLAVREGKLRAWSLPAQRSLLVRKSDLAHFREAGARAALTRQLNLFSADAHDSAKKTESGNSENSAA